MDDIIFRPYFVDDYSACLAVFDSNVPAFFAPEERGEFCDYLHSMNAADEHYMVMTCQGLVIGCGGITTDTEKRQASLSWGMVDKAFHGKGLGTRLTQCRLELARTMPNIDEVVLATSQYTHGFYEKFGFTVTKVTLDGFGSGLDQWDMRLRFI